MDTTDVGEPLEGKERGASCCKTSLPGVRSGHLSREGSLGRERDSEKTELSGDIKGASGDRALGLGRGA